MSLKFYGKSQEVAEGIIGLFESGNLPAALAPVFVRRHDDLPCRRWSFQNQLLTAISGTADARGFDQWKQAGRKVMKGARAFYILGPCLVNGKPKDGDGDGDGKAGKVLIGFRSIPVFRLEDTEIDDPELWERCGKVDLAAEQKLAELPLRQVAAQWGIKVNSYNGEGAGYLGYYSGGGSTIALGVENLSTWCHELCHAADDRNGTIKKGGGQDPGNEAVAELGGAVLLKLMGKDHDADLGGAWDYIKRYADGDKGKALRLCTKVLNRVCSAVALILDAAERAESVPELLAA